MTGRIEKTVFISYRRTNLPWALFIWQHLTMHGYDVFFDYQSIDSGNFEKVILDNIRTRAHFVLILTPSALERCKNPGDWLRREIETAIDEKRNIVPLMMEGFDFGSPLIKRALTGKLALISGINALPIHNAYVPEAMTRLRERFLNTPLSDVNLPTLQAEAEQSTELQQSAANKADPVKEEQLEAQTWFEKGYVFQDAENLDEAYRCYSNALRLDPGLYWANNNLGILLDDLKRYNEAEAAFRKAIELNPSEAKAYSNLGLLLDKKLKRYEEAETAHRKAIELNPSLAGAYSNLGLLLHEKLKRYDEAETTFRKAIELNPSLAEAYYNLGNLLKDFKRYNETETAYRKAIELNPEYATAYNNLAILLRLINRDDDAIPVLEKLVELEPDKGSHRSSLMAVLRKAGRNTEAKKQEETTRILIEKESEYNRACFEALCENKHEALILLKTAFEKGQSSKEWAGQDPDLENIRDDPRFKELVGM